MRFKKANNRLPSYFLNWPNLQRLQLLSTLFLLSRLTLFIERSQYNCIFRTHSARGAYWIFYTIETIKCYKFIKNELLLCYKLCKRLIKNWDIHNFSNVPVRHKIIGRRLAVCRLRCCCCGFCWSLWEKSHFMFARKNVNNGGCHMKSYADPWNRWHCQILIDFPLK